MHQLRWPQCCWRHPALSCHPEDEKRKLELDQGNLSQLSVHKGGLTWLLFEIHCKNKKKKKKPSHFKAEGDFRQTDCDLLAAGSVSQSEKEITWSDGNGNMGWEKVSSRLRVRRPGL